MTWSNETIFLQKNGITHSASLPYSPKSNRSSESLVQEKWKWTRVLMFGTNLPEHYEERLKIQEMVKKSIAFFDNRWKNTNTAMGMESWNILFEHPEIRSTWIIFHIMLKIDFIEAFTHIQHLNRFWESQSTLGMRGYTLHKNERQVHTPSLLHHIYKITNAIENGTRHLCLTKLQRSMSIAGIVGRHRQVIQGCKNIDRDKLFPGPKTLSFNCSPKRKSQKAIASMKDWSRSAIMSTLIFLR